MKILLVNPDEKARSKEPVTIGVPCPRGSIFSVDNFEFVSGAKRFPVQTTPLTHWPDKSVKWLLCDFLAELAPKETMKLQLQKTLVQPSGAIHLRHSDGSIEIDTGVAKFTMDSRKFLPFKRVDFKGKTLVETPQPGVWVSDQNARQLQFNIKKTEVECHGHVRLTLRFSGILDHHQAVKFDARLHYYNDTARSCMELTIHNSKAAKHPKGIWDLGDPSSFLFKELVLSLHTASDNIFLKKLKSTPNSDWQECPTSGELRIYQESSGGKNWDSPNHRNRNGDVPMQIKGYQVLKVPEIIERGDRSQPLLWAGVSTGIGLSIVVPRFWQEFPKAASMDRNRVCVSFFPAEFPDFHELQGGEQKTHTVFIDFGTSEDNAGWGLSKIEAVPEPESVNISKVLPEIICGVAPSKDYEKYLQAALDGETSFFAKREIIDEYGWRNFGDLYADHEAVFDTSGKPFISHYNNQYDPLASFYREFLRSGDVRWKELAEGLARHVLDIDINHTDLDREEFCHGLFWHTDHYLDADLATHRCVSKGHLRKKTPELVGGGPGAQHCYTTGLKFHYYMTGDLVYREAVLGLTNWCCISLQGSQTILAALLRGVRLVRTLKTSGKERSVISKYPLDRGSGNCLKAYLDAYELTGNKHYLTIAGDLVKGTIHPADCVPDRGLLNAEITWSYTVFLASVGEYLECKISAGEMDEDFYYASQSLKVYADWMAKHERFYLDYSEALHFPNETWAAQELRKSVVFYFSAKYSKEMKTDLQLKAEMFAKRALSELSAWGDGYLTRPTVLILQNGWVVDALKQENLYNDNIEKQCTHEWGEGYSQLDMRMAFKEIIEDVISSYRKSCIRKEWNWLVLRL